LGYNCVLFSYSQGRAESGSISSPVFFKREATGAEVSLGIHAFSDFGGKMRLLGHNFGSRHGQARAQSTKVKQGLYRRGRSSSFQKKFDPKFWPIGLASRACQIWSRKQKHPHFPSPSQANYSPK